MDFCIECRKNTEYILQKRPVIKTIGKKEYSFGITAAVCAVCGKEMSVSGLIDQNIREIDEQYRAAEGIISADDIEKLMKIYKIGKVPLSLALGFEEVTISRYLAGQIPSKEHSDIMRLALSSPSYMQKRLENLFSVSGKMLKVVSCVLDRLEEITPLMLQKLLYFIQGIYQALYGQPVFAEDCEAWVHGPVYPAVYDLFRDFRYNPIDDAGFSFLGGAAEELTDEERRVVDLVVNTFGLYGGKALERITHNETPWRAARRGYGDNIPSHEILTKESIRSYYESVNKEYDISSEEGLNQYIQDRLRRAF